LWDHFAFTRDTNYLRNTAYPMLKETCQFFQQYLKALPYATNGVPAGTLVVPNGWSPEHGPDVEDGVTCDQVLVWDVFNNCQQAASILNTDAVYAASVAVSQANLLKPRIGSWGQLREWFYTQDTQGHDGNSSYMQMIGIYPGRQLVPEVAPWLAAGVRTKLASVGDTYNGDWDYIQHVTYYARLHDWQSAQHVLKLYYGVVFPNLMANVLGNAQMDSSCGVTAAIAELLLQSHAGYINLLPTLPISWPAGSVSGLRARGGYTVGMTWTNAAGSATVIPDYSGTCTVHAPNPPTVTLGGVPVAVTNIGFGTVQWPAVAGSNYVVQWAQPPFPAQTPAPADYATWVSGGNVTLTWVPGSSGYLHDVYFGSDSNAVASATTASPQYLGRTNGTRVGVTLPVLQTNALYFWRVDEAAGTNVGHGTLWQFTLAGTGPLAYSTATNNGNCIIIFTNGSGLWTPPSGVSNVEVLVVGGGGGGGGNSGGGGGGGGVIHSNGFAVSGPVTVAVGAAGVGGISGSAAPGNGSSSVFSSLTAMGSGSGASYGGSSMSYPAGSGGSGGGGCWPATPVNCTAGGSGTAGQGYSGGGIGSYSGGGGGGTSAAGASGSGRNGGNGGNGAQYSISGAAAYYGGGGGGGGDNGGSGTGGSGGLGGGGSGSNSGSSPTLPVAGTANTGGGGGGGCNTSSSAYQSGAAGGSGVVIVRYPNVPTRLAFVSVVPAIPSMNQSFSVTVQAEDASGNAGNVTSDTVVQLSKTAGSGTLSGTLSGTILSGTSSVVISGVIYSAAGAMTLTATETSGMSLTAGSTNLNFASLPLVATPTFSPAPGGYYSNLTVDITCGTSGSTVYYTTDGTTPTTSSPHGTAGSASASVSITMPADVTLKAYATESGYLDSAVASGTYVAVPAATWTNLAGGSWPVAGDWLYALVGEGSGVTADFSTLTLANNTVVTLDSTPTIGELKFGDLGNAYTWTINSGSGGPLTLDNGANTPVIAVSNQTTSFHADLAGTGGFTKSGLGTLSLRSSDGNPALSGTVVVSQGVLSLDVATGGAGELSGVSTIEVNAGGTLLATGGDAIGYTAGKEALVINGGAVTNSSGGALSLANPVSMTGGSLVATGNGWLTFFSATDQINATSDTNGNPAYISGLAIQDAAAVLNVTRGSEAPVADLIVNGVGWRGWGAGSLSLSGDGIMTLTGISTYPGTTTINGGTLRVDSPDALTTNALSIASSGKVNLNYVGTHAVSTLTLDGNLQPDGIYGSSASPATPKDDTHFAGTGTVTVGTGGGVPTGTAVTLAITPDGTGNYTISATTAPATTGLTLVLYKSNDLSLGMAGFAPVTDGGFWTDDGGGNYHYFPARNPTNDGTPSFYLVK
jgi:hypothetical protein